MFPNFYIFNVLAIDVLFQFKKFKLNFVFSSLPLSTLIRVHTYIYLLSATVEYIIITHIAEQAGGTP